MKRFFHIFMFFFMMVIVLVGCKTVSKSIDYYNACKNDTECFELMSRNANITRNVVVPVAETTTSSGAVASVIGLIASNVASCLTGIFAGKKLCKK